MSIAGDLKNLQQHFPQEPITNIVRRVLQTRSLHLRAEGIKTLKWATMSTFAGSVIGVLCTPQRYGLPWEPIDLAQSFDYKGMLRAIKGKNVSRACKTPGTNHKRGRDDNYRQIVAQADGADFRQNETNATRACIVPSHLVADSVSTSMLIECSRTRHQHQQRSNDKFRTSFR